MAKPDSLPVGRYFLALAAIFAILAAIVFWPGHKHTPKLGLDLVGGTQVIYTAKTENGSTPSSSSMNQAKQIIGDRVNGSGVTEATVVIQGSDQIVVSIPGDTHVDPATLGATAKLNFRGVVAPPVPVTCSPAAAKKSASKSPAAKPSGAAKGDSYDARLLTGPQDKKTPKAAKTPKATTSSKASTAPTATTTPSTAATPTAPSAPHACSLKSPTQLKKLVKDLPNPAPAQAGKPWTSLVYTSNGLSTTVATAVSAQLTNFDCAAAQGEKDLANDYYLVCDGQGLAYLLGPVIVPGTQISSAASSAPNPAQGQTEWSVNLSLKGKGQTSWAKYTGAHNVGGNPPTTGPSSCGSGGTACTNYVAFTLDGQVISSPYNNQAINGGNTQITGSFTQTTADSLAQQLKYGALPLNFKADTAQTVSATLGTSQLKAGMLAGGIGLALVILYSLLYYRALGLVTIASLMVSGGLVYGSIVMLGAQMGFTLSLAGIAGFIVAVGITTDSFVVFFERIKDEVHEGRSVRVAIPRAWIRARRTILSADTVSFLAAAILYYFAAGDVKGFAFTLGLSTILDVIVVFLFTHPLISLLSRVRAFGTGRLTGLAHIRDGVVVRPTEPDRPAARRSEPRPAPQPDEAARVQLSKSAVATLDEPTDLAEPDAAEDQFEDDSGGPESAERRHTTPAPGSAAERAAARRARMREKGER